MFHTQIPLFRILWRFNLSGKVFELLHHSGVVDIFERELNQVVFQVGALEKLFFGKVIYVRSCGMTLTITVNDHFLQFKSYLPVSYPGSFECKHNLLERRERR